MNIIKQDPFRAKNKIMAKIISFSLFILIGLISI